MLGAAAFTSTQAYALPHFGVHRHFEDPSDTRVRMALYNRGESFRDVKIGTRVYTVLPHQCLDVKAPEGTPIYTLTTGANHRKGDLLFEIKRSMQDRRVSID